MTTSSDINDTVDISVLHAIRVGGWLTEERIGAWVRVSAEALAAVLTGLLDRALLRTVATPQGQLYGTTEAGVATVDAALVSEQGRSLVAPETSLRALLTEFENADPAMKEVVTAFQRNRDQAGAEAVLRFHAGLGDLIDRIGAAGELWSGYPARFAAALAAIESGEFDAVASPLIDSYHTVWHMLHRDLRLTADSVAVRA